MSILVVVRVIALVCIGLLAGIFLGYRMGPAYALRELSPSSFVQFQQIVHAHYVRFMPPLTLVALLSALAWLFIIRAKWTSAEFWLVTASAVGIALIAGVTRGISVPLNNALMTWNVASPPANLRALWAPWERVNTLRALVATGVLAAQALALSLSAFLRSR